ncbi:hypothetical protein AB0O42_28170 [Streptomyces sp. NPDC089922]|uniref:hypothetical protein n=1 Tax=unclassified Streptomyces TaxID=2593676 RepID=UPI0034243AB5
MSAERAQGRGWVRIPASRAEQTAPARPTGYDRAPYAGPYDPPYGASSYGASYGGSYAPPHPADQPTIYRSVVERWRAAGRTLPGHPDEEWERLISQPYWPGR